MGTVPFPYYDYWHFCCESPYLTVFLCFFPCTYFLHPSIDPLCLTLIGMRKIIFAPLMAGLPFILNEKLSSKIHGMLSFFDASPAYHWVSSWLIPLLLCGGIWQQTVHLGQFFNLSTLRDVWKRLLIHKVLYTFQMMKGQNFTFMFQQ